MYLEPAFLAPSPREGQFPAPSLPGSPLRAGTGLEGSVCARTQCPLWPQASLSSLLCSAQLAWGTTSESHSHRPPPVPTDAVKEKAPGLRPGPGGAGRAAGPQPIPNHSGSVLAETRPFHPVGEAEVMGPSAGAPACSGARAMAQELQPCSADGPQAGIFHSRGRGWAGNYSLTVKLWNSGTGDVPSSFLSLSHAHPITLLHPATCCIYAAVGPQPAV